MQDRYVGDIGDYFKFGLLRALANGRKLGVAWYLFPDEDHNNDGRHISYLQDAANWAGYDPELHTNLQRIVGNNERHLAAIEQSEILVGAQFSNTPLETGTISVQMKRDWRKSWFRRVQHDLSGCDIVFADPDNGLCPDDRFSYGRTKDWKRVPFKEVQALAEGRTAVIYHHNTRFRGGHHAEIQHWLDQMPEGSLAIRVKPYSPRTFFVVNPTESVTEAAKRFAEDWSPHAEYIEKAQGILAHDMAQGGSPAWQDIEAAVKDFRRHFDAAKVPAFHSEGPIVLDDLWAEQSYWPSADYVGIYCILGANDELLYVGKASANSSIGKRLNTYFKNSPEDKKKWVISAGHNWPSDHPQPHSVAAIGIDKITSGPQPPGWAWLVPSLEEYLITRFSPPANTMQKTAASK